MRVAPGVTEAVIPQIQFLAQQLILNEEQIQRAKCEMEAIMETLSASEDTTSRDEDARVETEAVPAETEVHCSADEKTAPKPSRKLHDIEILSSLPGVGNVVLATLLSEASVCCALGIIARCDVCAALRQLPAALESRCAWSDDEPVRRASSMPFIIGVEWRSCMIPSVKLSTAPCGLADIAMAVHYARSQIDS